MLVCNNKEMEQLDLSNNTKLTILECRDNRISVLDISSIPALCELVINTNYQWENGYVYWGDEQSLYISTNITVIAGDYIDNGDRTEQAND